MSIPQLRVYIFQITKLLLPALILTCTVGEVNAQSNGKVSSKDYHEFINSMLDADSTGQFNLVRDAPFKPILDDTSIIFQDSVLFTREDVVFMKQQFKDVKEYHWKSGGIMSATIISDAKIRRHFRKKAEDSWTGFKKKFGGGYSRFSIPIFSLDRNTCVIYRSVHCGSLCGHGVILVYRKIDGVWKKITFVGTIWMS